MEVTDKTKSDVKVGLFEELFYTTYANMLFLLLDFKFSRSLISHPDLFYCCAALVSYSVYHHRSIILPQ